MADKNSKDGKEGITAEAAEVLASKVEVIMLANGEFRWSMQGVAMPQAMGMLQCAIDHMKEELALSRQNLRMMKIQSRNFLANPLGPHGMPGRG